MEAVARGELAVLEGLESNDRYHVLEQLEKLLRLLVTASRCVHIQGASTYADTILQAP